MKTLLVTVSCSLDEQPRATGRFITIKELKAKAHEAVVSYLGREPKNLKEKDEVVRKLLTEGRNEIHTKQ